MKKEVVRKTSLRDAEDALCADQTAAERLSILAFRDFAARPAFVPA